jgi:hypothetical protein
MKALKTTDIKRLYFIRWFHPLVIIWKRIGIDYVHANELEIIDGVLTGKYLGEIVVKESRVFESYC